MAKLFTKGQVVAAQFSGWHGCHTDALREVTILRVGPRWATFKANGFEYRADIETGLIEGPGFGPSSSGQLWQSQEAYRAHADLSTAWNRLVFALRDIREPNAGVDLAAVEQAAALLGIKL